MVHTQVPGCRQIKATRQQVWNLRTLRLTFGPSYSASADILSRGISYFYPRFHHTFVWWNLAWNGKFHPSIFCETTHIRREVEWCRWNHGRSTTSMYPIMWMCYRVEYVHLNVWFNIFAVYFGNIFLLLCQKEGAAWYSVCAIFSIFQYLEIHINVTSLWISS